MIHLGIDLGGGKIEVVAMDGAGIEQLRERIATPRGDYPATLEAIIGLVAAAQEKLGVDDAPIGIGIPGSETADGRVRNANSTWINGRPLRSDLETRLGRPVALANDANCFVLSEARDGAAAGAVVVFGVILGTGVGGGLVVDGRLLAGANRIAGEWGHNPLPAAGEPEGLVCWCGRRDCIELYLSGPGLAADHRRVTGAEFLSAPQIAAAAAAGDSRAATTLERYERRLALSLAQVINLLDPDVIVLGGGLSNIDRLYCNVPRLWSPAVFSERVETRLVRHRHGDSSGVRGAAWLAGQQD
ncbi:MAG: fructokinase [Betaproteobacteria bacterium HGW-Betaproteobacteria-11]|nr:MAG: fructokinase [Betaproteobacteria bacterium HGW-Betaproteobacteria-11]